MELNKIFAAILLAGLIGMSAGFVAELLVTPETPEQNAYVVETDGVGAAPVQQEETGPPPIAPLMAAADPAAGENLARACVACHVFDRSNENRVGPGLWDIVGQQIAIHEGFNYSNALEAHAEQAGVWSFEELNGFLYRPRDWVPGTSMSYAGIRNDQDRANMIAYLRSLSDDPEPLPDPEPEPAEEPEAGEAPEGEATDETAGDPPAEGETADEAGDGEPAEEPQADDDAGETDGDGEAEQSDTAGG